LRFPGLAGVVVGVAAVVAIAVAFGAAEQSTGAAVYYEHLVSVET